MVIRGSIRGALYCATCCQYQCVDVPVKVEVTLEFGVSEFGVRSSFVASGQNAPGQVGTESLGQVNAPLDFPRSHGHFAASL